MVQLEERRDASEGISANLMLEIRAPACSARENRSKLLNDTGDR